MRNNEIECLSSNDKEKLDSIIESLEDPEREKIMLLQKTQKAYGWLKSEHMRYLADNIGTSYIDLYGIATFYNQFKLSPSGRHKISVCMGTSCHVKGAGKLLEKLENILEICVNETTEDSRFTLEKVRCLGCCSLAPVIMIDDSVYGNVKTEDIPDILEEYTIDER